VTEEGVVRRATLQSEIVEANHTITDADAKRWIEKLITDKRVIRVRLGSEHRLIAIEDAARYRDAFGIVLDPGLPLAFLDPTKDALHSLVARYARTHGPFTATEIAKRWGIGEAAVLNALEALVGKGKVTRGAFLPLPPGVPQPSEPNEYCDVEVLRALKQKTLARLRKAIEPVSAEAFARFLTEWHGIVEEGASSRSLPLDRLMKVIAQLEGCPLPMSVLESEILPARVPGFRSHHLDQLLATGEVVWASVSPIGSSDGRIALYTTEREPLLAMPQIEDRPDGPIHAKIRELFERRGAVFFAEIARTVGGFPSDALDALWDLVWCGEVTNDSLEPLRSVARVAGRQKEGGRRAARAPRLSPRGGPPGSEGRWSLRTSRWEKQPTSTERCTATGRALLERYGVVLREAAGAEGLPGGFGYVYDVYRAMEDQGRVRRGYFVAGRGATQFALPGAEERLRMPRRDDDEGGPRVVSLAATDPANPYGSLLPWPDCGASRPQRSSGARVILIDGRLVAWHSRGASNLITFFKDEEPQDAERLGQVLRDLQMRRYRSMMIATINGVPAPESPFANVLSKFGFLPRQGALVKFLHNGPTFGRARPKPEPASMVKSEDDFDVGIDFDFSLEDDDAEAEAEAEAETDEAASDA